MSKHRLELKVGSFKLLIDVDCFVRSSINSKLFTNSIEAFIHLLREVAEVQHLLEVLIKIDYRDLNLVKTKIRRRIEFLCSEWIHVKKTRRKVEHCVETLMNCIEIDYI